MWSTIDIGSLRGIARHGCTAHDRRKPQRSTTRRHHAIHVDCGRAAVGAALTISSGGVLRAQTPKDTVVMARQIDDIITLDPAEIFEFSGVEFGANVYDRLIGVDVKNAARSGGELAESWTVSDDGKTYTFKIRAGREVPLRQSADRRGCGVLAPARGDAEQVAGLHPDAVRLHQGQRRSRRCKATDAATARDRDRQGLSRRPSS